MNEKIFKQEIDDWDRNTQFYANENLMPFQELIRKEIYDFYAIPENYKVLEAGGGIIKINKNTTLIDFSPRMIELAKQTNPSGRKIILASTHRLPFEKESFDVVVANGLFHHLKVQGILNDSAREFYRILKPNGKLCIFDRANNFIPKIFFYLRKPFKLFCSPKSTCSTRNELPFSENDIKEILGCGFEIEKKEYLIALPFQLLIIFTNVLQYIWGPKSAQVFQKKLKKIGQFLEKHFSFKPLCAEQCLVLKKK